MARTPVGTCRAVVAVMNRKLGWVTVSVFAFCLVLPTDTIAQSSRKERKRLAKQLLQELLEPVFEPVWSGLESLINGGNVTEMRNRLAAEPTLIHIRSSGFYRWTVLHAAVRSNNPKALEMCKLLVEAGAEINAENSEGNTPLHFSVYRQNREQLSADTYDGIIHLLLDNGADIESRNPTGATPLHFAARDSDASAAEVLLARGANVNEKTTGAEAFTPLHAAAYYGRADLVEVLLRYGANPELKDGRGWVPLKAAKKEGHRDVVEILRNAGVPAANPPPPNASEQNAELPARANVVASGHITGAELEDLLARPGVVLHQDGNVGARHQGQLDEGASLRIFINEQANLYVDGARLAIVGPHTDAPYVVENLAIGEHEIKAVPTGAGLSTWERTIEIVLGRPNSISIAIWKSAKSAVEIDRPETVAIPAPATVEFDPPATPAERRTLVEGIIREHLRGFVDRRLHLAPNIPQAKLDSAAQLHGFDPARVLLIWDGGLGKGAKTGFCITDQKVYWREIKSAPRLSLDLADVQTVVSLKNKFLVDGHRFNVVLAANPPYAAHVFGTLVQKLADVLSTRPLPPPPAPVQTRTETAAGQIAPAPTHTESAKLPASSSMKLILGVPFLSWGEAAGLEYEDKNILNPSFAASLGMVLEYWGQDLELLQQSANALPKGPEGWGRVESGEGKSLDDLKGFIDRGIPVLVDPSITPYGHTLSPMFFALAEAQIKEEGRCSGVLGRMVSLRTFRDVEAELGFSPWESLLQSSRVVIGYDDERKIVILHDPSFGPAWQVSFDDFEKMWEPKKRWYLAAYPPNHGEVAAKRPPAADYAPRTPDQQAAEQFVLGYALSCVGRMVEAEEHFKRGLAVPGIAKGYQHLLLFELALQYRTRGGTEEAIAAAQKATELVPEHHRPWEFLAQTYRSSAASDVRGSKAANAERKALATCSDRTAQSTLERSLARDFLIFGCQGILGLSE